MYGYGKEIYKGLVKKFGAEDAKQKWRNGVRLGIIEGYPNDIYVLYNRNLPEIKNYYKVDDKHPLILLEDVSNIYIDVAMGLYKTLPKSLTGDVSTNTWQDYKEGLYETLNKKIEDFNKKMDDLEFKRNIKALGNKVEGDKRSNRKLDVKNKEDFAQLNGKNLGEDDLSKLVKLLDNPNGWQVTYVPEVDGLTNIRLQAQNYTITFKANKESESEIGYIPEILVKNEGNTYLKASKFNLEELFNQYALNEDWEPLAQIKERRLNYVRDSATSHRNALTGFIAKRVAESNFELKIKLINK